MNKDLRTVLDFIRRQTVLGERFAPPEVLAAVARLNGEAKRRPRKVLAPGRTRAERKAERNERAAAIRAAVFLRAGSVCEFCAAKVPGSVIHPPEEWHHCIGGGLRRTMESVETTAAVCGDCHDGWDASDLDVLRAAKVWALRLGYRTALREIEHRMDKAMEARASRAGGTHG